MSSNNIQAINSLMQPINLGGRNYNTSKKLHLDYVNKGLFTGPHSSFIAVILNSRWVVHSIAQASVIPIDVNGSIDWETVIINYYLSKQTPFYIEEFTQLGAEVYRKINESNAVNFSDVSENMLLIDNSLDIFLNSIFTTNKSRWKHELAFKELLYSAFKEYKIIDQYRFGKYRVDFYFPEYGLCVEYDEKHHKHTKISDRERELQISKDNSLTFVRVKQGNEGDGIIKIYLAINSLKNIIA